MTKKHAFLATVSILSCLAAAPAFASVRYAAAGGSGTACSQSSPCSLTTAVGSAASGDTVIVNPGTYSGDLNIGVSNLSVTTTSAVITGLGTETCGRAAWLTSTIVAKGGDPGCGIFSGTDNRPILNGSATITAPGVSLQYMRIRGSSRSDTDADIVSVKAENVTVQNNELSNGGQGIYVWVKRNVTIAHNYIHALGTRGTTFDTHGVGICGTGTESTSFATTILVANNSIIDGGGDGVQEQTNAYCSGTFSYLTVEYNHMRDFDEQCGDFKGTRQLRWHGNDCSAAVGGGMVSTNDPSVTAKTDWDIWDNFFHDIKEYSINWAQNANCGRWRIWNNVFARTDQGPAYNEAAVNLCGDSGTYVVFNTFVDNSNGSSSPRTWAIYNYGASGGGSTGNNIRDNIFYRNGTGSDDHGHMSNLSGEDGGTPNTNYVNTPTSSCSAGCQVGTNPITACLTTDNCPGFSNPTADDFTLKSGSPAAGVGLAVGSHVSLTDSGNFTPSRDINGKLRPSRPSIGAFELGGTVLTAPAAPNNVRIIK